MQLTHLCHARDARGAETGAATAAWSVRAGEVTDQRTSLALAECMRDLVDEHYPEAERFASCSTTGLPFPGGAQHAGTDVVARSQDKHLHDSRA